MGLDPVSFVFAQVMQQVEWLYEEGHLSQKAYETVTANLLQFDGEDSPDPEPTQTASPDRTESVTSSSQSGNQYTQNITDTPVAASPRQTLDSRPGPRPPGSLAHPTRASKIASKFKKKSTAPPEAPERSSSSAAPPPPPPRQSQGPSQRQSQPQTSPKEKEVRGDGRRVPPPPGQKPVEEEPEQNLGPVNSRIRRAFEGGFLISSAVDQALALTPGVPEAFRERVVDRTEENVGPWVRAVTDPKNQKAIRSSVAKSYSSLSRKKTEDPNSRPSDRLRNIKPSNGMIPGFIVSDLTSEEEDGAPICISSVHSFLASAEWQITSVVTASYVGLAAEGED